MGFRRAMLVSAVVCSHCIDQYEDLVEAVTSLLEQTHGDLEVVVVVDGSEELHDRVVARYGGNEAVRIVHLKQNVGASGARNAGIGVARGDPIAFIDDDAIADRTWMENLLAAYRDYDAVAVAGKILPVWVCQRPAYLPEELYWLVGVTHRGFAGDRVVEVRNAFGPNMSFRREVFDKVGLFNEHLGFSERSEPFIQAEEPEFSLRMRERLGKGVIYSPDAVVYHKIGRSKLGIRTLLRRSFYQGYSKALLAKLRISTGSMAEEKSYLRTVLLECLPRRAARAYKPGELKKLLFLVACLVCVGLGFMVGYAKRA